jgi:hypothetical protein
MVRTDGPDGALRDYPIAYTFGVYPLQQYLIAMPGGRLQALGVAWDSRPKEQGGQRWFHLRVNTAIGCTLQRRNFSESPLTASWRLFIPYEGFRFLVV